MKNFTKIAALAAMPLLLIGCAKQVDFQDFKTKALEAAETRTEEVDYITFKGVYDGKEYNFTNESILSMSVAEIAIASAISIELNVEFYTLTDLNDEEAGHKVNYYVGNGFKVEHSKNKNEENDYDWKREYNTKGYLTRYYAKVGDTKTDMKLTYTFK